MQGKIGEKAQFIHDKRAFEPVFTPQWQRR